MRPAKTINLKEMEILNDIELKFALRLSEHLLSVNPDGESKELDIILDIIEKYENENFRIEQPDPDELEKYRKENKK